MLDVLLDAVLDSLKILPFLLVIYILMELIESARRKDKIEKALSSKYAPLVASAVGIVPECGFAVMCSKLYDKGLIKIGTLIAAFIAVSDEGVVVLLSGGEPVIRVILLMAIKIVYAIIVGLVINALLSKKDDPHVCPPIDSCIECGEKHEKKIDKFFLHPLWHALTIFLYILILNIIFGFLIYFVGEDNIGEFVQKSLYVQPIVASLVGLIPNCASSAVLASAYLNGFLSFAALVGGLSANAGIGILILFKSAKKIKKALLILSIMFLSGIVIGYILLPMGI